MQSEIESISRLKNPKFKVSCHYLITRKGKVIQMVRERNVAWHAGISFWRSDLHTHHSFGCNIVLQYATAPQGNTMQQNRHMLQHETEMLQHLIKILVHGMFPT